LASYSANPDELTLNAIWWPQVPPRERERAICHELGHHDTGAIFFWTDDPRQQVNLRVLEAKADRAGLERLIPDWQVGEALRMGCQEPYEFAEHWGVDELTARERLAVYSPLAFRR
jgi:hypothetical protein